MDKLKVFIVAGRLGKSLTLSKTEPFLASKKVGKIYIFRENPGFILNGATYITVPSYILKIKPGFIQYPIRLIYEFIQLLYYSFKLKPDIINGVGVKPKGWYSVIVSKLTKAKCIFSLIGGVISITTYWPQKRLWKKVNLWMIRNSDIVTTKGEAVKNYLVENNIDAKKIFVLNGSIDINKFYFNNSKNRDIDLLFVGQFRPLKGPDRYINIVNLLKKDYPDIKAAMLGTGKLFFNIKKEIERLKLINNILLIGYVENPATYFQNSKILIMPSTSEGLPTTMLEAMSCGCVPVVSNVGNIKDAAKHDKNALIVESCFETKTFTKYAKLLISNETKRSQMAKNGRVTVEEKYSLEKQTKIVDHIIDYLFN